MESTLWQCKLVPWELGAPVLIDKGSVQSLSLTFPVRNAISRHSPSTCHVKLVAAWRSLLTSGLCTYVREQHTGAITLSSSLEAASGEGERQIGELASFSPGPPRGVCRAHLTECQSACAPRDGLSELISPAVTQAAANREWQLSLHAPSICGKCVS